MRSSGAEAAALGTETGQRLGQQVRTELRGAAAAVGQLGQAEGRRLEGGHDSMIGPRLAMAPPGPSRATIAAGADGSRWVPWSSTPVARRSARRGGFDSHAFPPRRGHVAGSPASPERRAAARRGRGRVGATARDPDALTAVAREVVADERARLAAGEPRHGPRRPRRRRPATGSTASPAHGIGLTTVINATGVDPPHEPRPGAVAGRRDRGRDAGGRVGYSLLEFDREAGRRGAAVPGAPRSTSSR